MTPISNLIQPSDYDKKIQLHINGIDVWVDYDDVNPVEALAVAASIFTACRYEMPKPDPEVLDFLGYNDLIEEVEPPHRTGEALC